MHLLIDGQALQTPTSRHRGIGRYSSNLLRALAAARPDWRIEIVQNSALPPIAPSDRAGLPILSFSPPAHRVRELCELNERYYADWLTARGPDGVLLLSHCEGWEAVVPSFCGARPRVFGIAYDLIPLVFPEHYLTDFPTAHWYAHRFRQFLRSDALLAISEATAQDVRALSGGATPQVVNIAGAVDPLFSPLSPNELAARAERLRQRFALHRDFILYVGAPDYRKNLHGAIRAFAALPTECRSSIDLALVCRLSGTERAAIEETACQLGIRSELRLICSAADEELRALYQMCRLFFFPSLYEGLGLPVLEALHCGAPVVASDRSSLPEYAGPVSWRGDPTSPTAMACLLEEALAEPRDARRAERQAFARTFSWAKTAQRACAVMERTVKQIATAPPQRRRLAWIVPLTPLHCDATANAVDRLASLAECYDIEVIAPSSPIEIPEALSRHHLILTAQEVRARHVALPYDLFVYQAPPSPWPSGMLDLFRQFPGLILAHESSSADPRRLIGRIEFAVRRHEQTDGLWRGFAVQSLADDLDDTDAILDSWAKLRARGQRQLAERRCRA
jgi:glycosyltransferase involved in cell wall biosynthesis